MVALQLLLKYWTKWGLHLIFWVFLIAMNLLSVRFYGEMNYHDPSYSAWVPV